MATDKEKYWIEGITIPDKSYSFYSDEESQLIDNISKVNLFIGENNSGKSRFLRELFIKEFGILPHKFKIEEFKSSINCFLKKFDEYRNSKGINNNDSKNFKGKITGILTTKIMFPNNELLKVINVIDQEINGKKSKTDNHIGHLTFPEIGQKYQEKFDECFEDFKKKYGENIEEIVQYPTFMKIYIPILRGMRPFSYQGKPYLYEDIYKTRIIDDYFKNVESNENREIFTGIWIYKEVKRHLLGNLEKRKLIADYQDYLSKNFFDRKEIALIPSIDEHEYLTIKIGKEKERPIFELGDGIQSIIMITFPLFIHKNENVLLFIDEPEQYMHPGLQRKLLETLLNQEGFEHFQYFITTHSNHFLDMTLDYNDISIFSLHKMLQESENDEKDPKFIIENLSTGDRAALDYLGVRNSSVFLSNCTIWVEGVTDRWYIRKFLELCPGNSNSNKFEEDLHYSFVEYGGNNITHWSFLDKEEKPIEISRLCGRLFLIADSDGVDNEKIEKINNGTIGGKTTTAKEERIAHLREYLKEQFYQIQNKEIENTLSASIIRKIMESYGEVDIPDFTEKDYKDKNLGEFIDILLGENRQRQGSYGEGNTIKSKDVFCKKAIGYIESWDDLSEENQDLATKVYEFIKEHNA